MAVLDLKAKIAEKTNIPAGMQRVIFKGKVLHDDKDLSFYCIFNQLLYISSSSSFFFFFESQSCARGACTPYG